MRKFAAWLLAAVLLAGCGLGNVADPGEGYRELDMAPSDVTGTWQNAQRGGVLVFREDGTFTVGNLPYQVFDHMVGVLPSGFDKKLDRIDETGTWELEGDPREPGKRRSHIRLRTDGTTTIGGGSSLELFAQWQGSAIVLVFFFGDPDLNNRYIYEKCSASCLPLPTPSSSIPG